MIVRAASLSSKIPFLLTLNVTLSEAPSHGKPALVYDTQAAGSLAYIELAKEVILNQNKNYE